MCGPTRSLKKRASKVHVAALRRALGDGNAGRRFIANVPGRGYSFVAAVSVSSEQTDVRASLSSSDRASSPTFRRHWPAWSDVRMPFLCFQNSYRGIASSRLSALEASGRQPLRWRSPTEFFRNFTDGVHFVDFAPLTEPQLVASTLAARLGVAAHGRKIRCPA